MAGAIAGALEYEEMGSLWPQAKSRSDLPTFNRLPEVVGLGGLEYERFATEIFWHDTPLHHPPPFSLLLLLSLIFPLALSPSPSFLSTLFLPLALLPSPSFLSTLFLTHALSLPRPLFPSRSVPLPASLPRSPSRCGTRVL